MSSGDDSQAPQPDATVGETSLPLPDLTAVPGDSGTDVDAGGVGGTTGSSTSKGGGCAAAPQPGHLPTLLPLLFLGWAIRLRWRLFFR